LKGCTTHSAARWSRHITINILFELLHTGFRSSLSGLQHAYTSHGAPTSRALDYWLYVVLLDYYFHPCSLPLRFIIEVQNDSGTKPFTANNSTEGAAKRITIWDIFKELSIARPIPDGFPPKQPKIQVHQPCNISTSLSLSLIPHELTQKI
jgi:hypothetical protein